MANSTLPGQRVASRVAARQKAALPVRIAIYLRVSTRNQVEGSGLDQQEKDARAWIEFWFRDVPFEIVGVFVDDGISGKIDNRRDQVKLKAANAAGNVDLVISQKLDRFGRTMRDIQRWVWEMNDQGLRVVTADGRIDSQNEMFELVLALLAYMAQLEHELIFSRTFNGREAKIDAGGWAAGPPPFGFMLEGMGTKEGSRTVLSEDECRVLAMGAECMIDQGMNYSETVDLLNEKEMFTRSGRPWTVGNWIKRISHEAILECCVTYRKNNGWKNGTKQDEDGNALYGEAKRIPMPEVFTPERREALNEVIAKLSFESRRANSEYPLSGRIDGHCGNVYIGGGVRGEDTRVYRCKGVDDGCDDVYLDATDTETAVWAQLTTLLNDPKRIEMLAKEWVESLPGTREKHDERVMTLRAQVEAKEDEIADVLLMCHKNRLPDRVREKSLAKPNRELMALQASLQEAEAWLEDYEATQQEAKEMEQFISSARLRVGDLTLAEKSELFAMFDVRVSAGNHRFKKRSGRPCPVTEWHKATRHLVPADIDEDDWVMVKEILSGYVAKSSFTKTTIDLRLAFNGMFHRLRTGTPWNEMTDAFGNPQRIRERQLTLFQRGAWKAIVEVLNQRGGGTPVYVAPTIPPLKITGRVARSLWAVVGEEGLVEAPEVPPSVRPEDGPHPVLTAGFETTVNLIGNGMYALLRHPEQRALLQESLGRGESGLLATAVEELLRYDGPVELATWRFAVAPLRIGGVDIPVGDPVLVVLAAADRDPARFAAENTLDLARADNPHLGFGHGIHYCIGAPLARLEGQAALASLLTRLPDIQLSPSVGELRWRGGLIMRGLRELPVEFTPEGASATG